MKKVKILAIVGSLREDSFNKQLALKAKEIAKEHVKFELLDYKDVPMMNQDIEFPAPEAVKRVREAVKNADGIWFFTPEYNHFFSGVLKNLIDWLSRPISENEQPILSGKPAAISGISPGMSGTGIAQDHLVSLLSFLNMDIMNSPRLTIPNAFGQVDNNGKLALQESLPFLETQTDAFIVFILKKASVFHSYLNQIVEIKIDRPIGSVHPKCSELVYPINYGYIPNVLGRDGEELDVYLLGVDKPVNKFSARVIAIIHRHNDVEDKLVAAPDGINFTKNEIAKAVLFQEKYYEIDIETI